MTETSLLRHDLAGDDAATGIDVEIVVPVYDEQAALDDSVRRLHRFLSQQFPFSWTIAIIDNASTDATPAIGAALAAELPGVAFRRLERKGRGHALRTAWSASSARVVAYMDVDLSTDLRALLPLVAPLLSGHSDVAIGSRLAPGARVTRGPKREVISRAYNRILHAALRARFSDAQCGFKAVRTETARRLLADIRDDAWFFDTELLVLAQRRGLRIHEVPVDWVDDPDSRVDVLRTAADDLRGVARLALQTSSASASPAPSPTRSCTSRSRGRSARPAPTRWPWRSPRSPTPRPTAGSPSGSGAAPGSCASMRWALWSTS
jgi:hypothetical protein